MQPVLAAWLQIQSRSTSRKGFLMQYRKEKLSLGLDTFRTARPWLRLPIKQAPDNTQAAPSYPKVLCGAGWRPLSLAFAPTNRLE